MGWWEATTDTLKWLQQWSININFMFQIPQKVAKSVDNINKQSYGQVSACEQPPEPFEAYQTLVYI